MMADVERTQQMSLLEQVVSELKIDADRARIILDKLKRNEAYTPNDKRALYNCDVASIFLFEDVDDKLARDLKQRLGDKWPVYVEESKIYTDMVRNVRERVEELVSKDDFGRKMQEMSNRQMLIALAERKAKFETELLLNLNPRAVSKKAKFSKAGEEIVYKKVN